MKKTRKKLVGLFGLAFVVAMTIFASTLPSPMASAISTVTDHITVVVRNPEEAPAASIGSPDSGDRFITPDQEISINYHNIKSYKLIVTYTDENGVEHPSKTVVEESVEGGVGPAAHSFRGIAEQFGYGKYTIRLDAIGDDDAPLPGDTIKFEYVAIEADSSSNSETGNPYIDLNFDQDQESLTDDLKIDRVVITIYDKDGNPVDGMPPIVVKPPVEKVEIPFDQYGISEGEYTLVIQPFNSADEALFDTVVLNINYTGEEDIVVPSTADTGGMFKNLNISRADYLITGLGLFLIVGIGGIVFIRKHGKSNKRRR